ncbi:MAG TPA: HD domain-containing phosphohydrolase [Anaerolineales bacterium]|nr:HD domain-containing phosphohydrolase [Anaerolineales bacterium]
MRKFIKSLHSRLIALILLASLPMVALVFYNDLQDRIQARQDVEAESVRLARIMAAEHERILNNAAQFVVSLADRPAYWFPGLASGNGAETCTALFAGLIAENPSYSGIALVDTEGTILCSHPASPTPQLAEFDSVGQAIATGELVVSGYEVGSLSGKQIVIVSAPVRGPSGEIIAGLGLGIDLDWASDFIELVDLSDQSSFFIVDREGVVLIRRPEAGSYVGTSGAGLRAVSAALTGGEPGILLSAGLDGVERLYAYAPILEPVPLSGYVLVGIPVAEAYHQADITLARSMVWLAVFTIVILGGARVVAMRWFLGPLARLTLAVERLQAGDLSARTGLPYRGDEFSGLARSFDEMADSLQQSKAQVNGAYDRTLEGWSRALDLRDHETEGHSRRVTEMTVAIARAMGLGDEALAHIRRGALLHDIGKIGIPDAILNKPGPLAGDEWTIMRRHPQVAYDLLKEIDFLRPALVIPLRHHEKWDGTGYPDGLVGEQIPLAARIFAVADVWDALRFNRPYRPAWDDTRALSYIRSQSGTHFDPDVVRAFFRTISRERASGRMGEWANGRVSESANQRISESANPHIIQKIDYP